MRIEQEQDQIGPLGKPRHHLREIIPPIDPLLLPRQNTRRIHQGNRPQHAARQLTPLEPTQKAHPESLQAPKRQIGVHAQGIARNGPLLRPVDQTGESIRRRLRPDSRTRKVPPEHVADETRLSYAVLADQHDLGFGVEFDVGEEGGFIEIVVAVAFFGGEDVFGVDGFELGGDAVGFGNGFVGARGGGGGGEGGRVGPVGHGDGE
mmetsp:Transcript_29198/g.62017  ORF Transcript_29198/g.62017 Transcript_29198/m.62017 type:complete len:206 (-) Transcript_29198:21-638(-)